MHASNRGSVQSMGGPLNISWWSHIHNLIKRKKDKIAFITHAYGN